MKLTGNYSDSGNPIKKGDRIRIGSYFATVNEVCVSDSEIAKHYYCEDTGGLLITYDDGALTLIPFGNNHDVTKIELDTPTITRSVPREIDGA